MVDDHSRIPRVERGKDDAAVVERRRPCARRREEHVPAIGERLGPAMRPLARREVQFGGAARHRLDVSRILRAFAQQLAQQKDLLTEVRFFDDRVGPDAAHEIVLRDDPAGLLDQNREGVERPDGDRDRLLAAEQAPRAWIKPEWPEDVHLRILERN